MKKYIDIEDELSKLKNAFPKFLIPDINSLVSKINAKSEHSANWGYEMCIDGENIEIPSRIYWDESKLKINGLTDNHKMITACILTRHHNGYVREKNLEKLILSEKYWTIPYVIQLIGEYVIELLELIWEKFESINKENLVKFIIENETYWFKTKQRIASYWDCYHRYEGKTKSDYIGFKLIDRIENLSKK
ncbi:hypothetical protein M0D21_05745 [Aquimarina sp. D1M17]|uniref:hypothetical protein n=1 Tax=Aquimarina acroporae TaxID=2937283 RepID=UPI0020C150A3|nr:hypothetical protein [Aquimarina acroporae]MCK8521058.1 hypothetical protein [Aquimarina acroporae]